jgi:hypothetical protein
MQAVAAQIHQRAAGRSSDQRGSSVRRSRPRRLRERRISAVLHNDLRADARLAMRTILDARGVLPTSPVRTTPGSDHHPYNVLPEKCWPGPGEVLATRGSILRIGVR